MFYIMTIKCLLLPRPQTQANFLPRCMECSRGIAMGILSVRLSNACIVHLQRTVEKRDRTGKKGVCDTLEKPLYLLYM